MVGALQVPVREGQPFGRGKAERDMDLPEGRQGEYQGQQGYRA